MAQLRLGRLMALIALLGLFAMHGFMAGHDSGHCLAAEAGDQAHHAGGHPAAASPAGSGDVSGSVMAAQPAGMGLAQPSASAFALSISPSVADQIGLVLGEVGCGPLGVGGLCLAVLLVSLLLALLLAAWRRWGPPQLLPTASGRGLLAGLDAVARVRGPSLVQLCVLRT